MRSPDLLPHHDKEDPAPVRDGVSMRLERRHRRDGVRHIVVAFIVVVGIDVGAEGGGPARPRAPDATIATTTTTTTNARIIVVAPPPPPPFVVVDLPKRLRPAGVRSRHRRIRDGTTGRNLVRNLGVRMRHSEGGGTRANERRWDDDRRVRIDCDGRAFGNVRPVRAGRVDTDECEGDGGAQDVRHGSGGEGERGGTDEEEEEENGGRGGGELRRRHFSSFPLVVCILSSRLNSSVIRLLSYFGSFGFSEKHTQYQHKVLSSINANSELRHYYLMIKILVEYEKGEGSPWFPWLNS